jgi:hypothetical protein
LQSDATNNNAAQFKIDSQQYHSDQRTSSLDAISAIRAVHSKTVNSTLKSDNDQLQSAQKSCHFAANAVIQVDQAKLNLLAGQNRTPSFQSIVGQAQVDITNAQTALNSVGSNQYTGIQSSTIWSNIKAAGEMIHQLQQIVNHKH